MCTVHVHWRVAPVKCRGSEKGGNGGRSYRAGARAVGRATSVSEAYTVCVQCTYMGGPLPGSEGQRGRR